MVFEEEILRKLKPGAKVYVIPVDFFERSETLPTQDVMHNPTSHYQYRVKYLWELVHRQICEKISAIGKSRRAMERISCNRNGNHELP